MMKKLRKILVILLVSMILLWTKVAYATTSVDSVLQQIGGLKYICIGVGVLLILLVLWISYKSDKTQENKENHLDNDDEDEEEEEPQNQQEETENLSLYDVYEKNVEPVKPSRSKKITPSEKSSTDFRLDDIFDEEVPEIEYDELREENKAEINEFNTLIEENNTDSSLEDDFLMQMNKNLAPESFSGSEELEDLEDFEVKEVKPRKRATSKEPTKRATRKTVKTEEI